MNWLEDGQNREYWKFITGTVIAGFLAFFLLWYVQGQQIKKDYLIKEQAMASALLSQGVEQGVIRQALENETVTEEGERLLAGMGISEGTGISFLPAVWRFQSRTGAALGLLLLLLAGALLGGTVSFMRRREALFLDAAEWLEQYARGKTSQRPDSLKEGSFYGLLEKIDQLVRQLSAKGETEKQVKDFLKETISDISHQLKTPLAALTMYNEIISREPEKVELVKEFSAKTESSLERIGQLIQMLLKITRLDAGAVLFEKQSYPMVDVVERALQELKERAGREKKELKLLGREDVWVTCDLAWTAEALGNLVKNALDHTEEGDRIVLSWEENAQIVHLTVEDNGCGIREEDFYHIFKRFYRSSSDHGKHTGAGLGLPLAKSIIEGQGGVISARSEPSCGAAFTVMLPGSKAYKNVS